MEFTLDIKTWRSGGNGVTKLGVGSTHLRNIEGYMCCVGQFAEQCGATTAQLLCRGTALSMANDSCNPYAAEELVMKINDDYYQDRGWVRELYSINDDPLLPAAEKVMRIRQKLESAGHTLTVINEELLNVG